MKDMEMGKGRIWRQDRMKMRECKMQLFDE